MNTDNNTDNTEIDYATYADGSGKASQNLAFELSCLKRREDVINTLRAFIKKHRDTLAGLSWRVEIYDPEIHMDCRFYRGKKTNAEEVALLWPEMKWKRVEPRHGINREFIRDWLGSLDGVAIRIRDAEVYEKNPTPPWKGKGPIRLRGEAVVEGGGDEAEQ